MWWYIPHVYTVYTYVHWRDLELETSYHHLILLFAFFRNFCVLVIPTTSDISSALSYQIMCVYTYAAGYNTQILFTYLNYLLLLILYGNVICVYLCYHFIILNFIFFVYSFVGDFCKEETMVRNLIADDYYFLIKWRCLLFKILDHVKITTALETRPADR